MQKILVTGAGGYIGSVTTDVLLASGYDVLALDNFSHGYKQPLIHLQQKYGEARLTVINGDLTAGAATQVFEQEKDIVAVVHFAALLDVGESWKIPEKYFTNNVGGTQELAAATIAAGVKNFIFSSSCTVYGNAQYSPIDEAHPISAPVTPYGASKRISEEILEWYTKTGKLNSVFLRYFNVCGATDDSEIGDSKKPSFHLVQNCVRGALGLAPFHLNYAHVATPDGSPIRDYVNVVDLAIAHAKALDWVLQEGKSDAFNLGTGSGNSVLEIVEAVKKITGVDFPVAPSAERRAGEADKMVADNTKAKEILGWEPTHSLEDSVRTLVAWYQKHPSGWER